MVLGNVAARRRGPWVGSMVMRVHVSDRVGAAVAPVVGQAPEHKQLL